MTFLSDLRHAWRTLTGMPVLASVVVLSLGIGIGVNATVFSWISTFLFNPLPGVDRAGTLQLVEPITETGGYPGTSWREYQDLRDRIPAIPDPIAFRMSPMNLGEIGRTERVFTVLVSGNYFTGLGLSPAAGRFIRPDEVTRPGGAPVAVISHDFWQTRFAASRNALGSVVRLNGVPHTIVGVAPERFQGTVLGLQFDIWLPATMAPIALSGSRELEDRNQRGYNVMGRLAPAATPADAQAQADAAMQALARDFPESNGRMGARVLPFWRAPRGPQVMFLNALGVLQGIMLVLLLAVCGNTANLLLARATTRHREVGIRLAVGAAPWRVLRLLATENLALGLAGAGLGLVIAVWGTNALRALPLSTALPVRFQTSVDPLVMAFGVALGVISALVFGLAPALQLARVDPSRAFRSSARGAGRNGLRRVLMGAQVCLALVVLLVAGLFLRSFSQTTDSDPGFAQEGLLLAAYDLSGRNPDDAAARDFAARLLEGLDALPDVQSAAIALSVPLDIHGLPQRAFTIDGRATADAAPDRALSNVVTPDYFRTMGIEVLEGPGLAPLTDVSAPPQVAVNRAFVDRFIGEGEVIGRGLRSRDRAYVIAAIVETTTSDAFGEAATPVIYFSYRDRPIGAGEIHIRTRAGAEMLLAPEVRRVVRDLDPALPVYNVRTMVQHLETNMFLRRIPAQMFAVLGPLILVLAAIGIYAVVSYTVAHRTAEIGVRMALGATAQGVVRQIVREHGRVIVAGAFLGWFAMWGVNAHLVRRPLDALVFGGIPAVLLAVAFIASWLPARRAAAIDPVRALRAE